AIAFRQGHGGVDLDSVLVRVAAQPQAVQNFQTMPARDLRHLIETVLDRIRPNAIGDLLKPRQILVDLPRLDVGAGFEGALAGADRRVRDAVELLACRERRVRHFDRGAQPPPDTDNRRGGTCEQSRPNSHRRSDVTSNGPSKGAWRN